MKVANFLRTLGIFAAGSVGGKELVSRFTENKYPILNFLGPVVGMAVAMIVDEEANKELAPKKPITGSNLQNTTASHTNYHTEHTKRITTGQLETGPQR